MLPGDGGQVVTVDIALKLKYFSGLKNNNMRKRGRQTDKVSYGGYLYIQGCAYLHMYAE